MSQVIEEIASVLKQEGWQLVTAESCTGGLIAGQITELPGSSSWFERGFVTYSNLAKEEMLGVPKSLIVEFGAVSEEVALAMAVGALEHSRAHVALSVTGIAGPDGGSIDKPVGTVCFGWAMRGKKPITLKRLLPGSRHEVRLAACEQALDEVLRLLRF